MRFIQFSKLKHLPCRFIQRLELYGQRSSSRRQLLALDDDLLQDIGITQQQAVQEGRRYFWQGDDRLCAKVCAGEQLPGKGDLIELNQGI